MAASAGPNEDLGRPSAEEITKALKTCNLVQIKRLAHLLGVPCRDIGSADDFAKKWLAGDVDATWEKLTSALVKLAMDCPPTSLDFKPIVNPNTGRIPMKMVICGPFSGKSTLLAQFTCQSLEPHLTIAPVFAKKSVSISGESVELQMWDTAALHKSYLSHVLQLYLRTAHGIVLVYDITNMESFEELKEWIEYLQKCTTEETEVVLVGTKVELKDQRAVSRARGEMLAEERGFHFFEASGLTGENVNEVFYCLAEQLMRKRRKLEEDDRISLSPECQTHIKQRSRCF